MKIGIIFCSYGVPEYLEQSIKPWVELKKINKDIGVEIAAVSDIFKEYWDMNTPKDLETYPYLNKLLDNKEIDFLYGINHSLSEKLPLLSEAEVRDKACQYLLNKGVDIIWLWDGDEITTLNDINNVISYINNNKFYAWFKTHYKNLTFKVDTYTKGFCPPRIFRTKFNNYTLTKCSWDNDFLYNGTITRDIIKQESLPNKVVPESLFNPLHFTWLNEERSKSKIEYQERHFAHGAGCSFKWDEKLGLQFNEEYYKKTGQKIPELYNI